MKTCFEGIARVKFNSPADGYPDGDEESIEILGMVSSKPEDDPENVNFSEPVFAEGAV